FFNETATPCVSPPSLHDALPIFQHDCVLPAVSLPLTLTLSRSLCLSLSLSLSLTHTHTHTHTHIPPLSSLSTYLSPLLSHTLPCLSLCVSFSPRAPLSLPQLLSP